MNHTLSLPPGHTVWRTEPGILHSLQVVATNVPPLPSDAPPWPLRRHRLSLHRLEAFEPFPAPHVAPVRVYEFDPEAPDLASREGAPLAVPLAVRSGLVFEHTGAGPVTVSFAFVPVDHEDMAPELAAHTAGAAV